MLLGAKSEAWDGRIAGFAQDLLHGVGRKQQRGTEWSLLVHCSGVSGGFLY
jgi:hypothetical protein